MSPSKSFTIFTFTVLAAICLKSCNAASNREAFRKLFGCPLCEAAACAPLDPPGCLAVLEPGVCACCPMCARSAGENCGLVTGRCGKGLSCRPRAGDPDPLGSLLDGTAVCV
ncbi:hypothetical protein ACOMHN_004750 [Nucella lapillus]